MSKATSELIVLHDRRDRPEANRLVRKLESVGYRVARQDGPAGFRKKAYAPTVVLWSRNAGALSLRSALENDSAVIAKLDSRAAPLGAHVTDLRGWRGQDCHHGWQTLLEAVGPAMTTAPLLVAAPILSEPVLVAAAPAPAKPASLGMASKSKNSSAKATKFDLGAEPKSGMSGVAIAIIILVAIAACAGGAALFVL